MRPKKRGTSHVARSTSHVARRTSHAARRTRPVALITGAGRGIGLATAEAFADAGYAVVIAERAAARGRSAERALRTSGHEALFVRTDVAKPGHAERAVTAAIKRFGRLDCLVNNAGVLTIGPLHRVDRGEVEEIVRVNLLGSLLMTRAVLPMFRRRRRGTIVNVASLLGKEGVEDYVAYCATKFGVIGITEALADELRGTRVSVWAVCPGQVDTPMGRKAGVTPGDYLIPPENVARVIVSLATRRRRRPSGAAVDVTR
jgi:NAD(P)-dependent dehydrogenase (short-subunit alcohol dehydrogenase family)